MDDIICSFDEIQIRINFCSSCENLQFEDDITKCANTGCNISYMTTIKFKNCPKENW